MSKNNEKLKAFIRATAIRAVRTFAQAVIAYLGSASLLSDVNWLMALSAGCFGAIVSVLMALATGLPEAKLPSDGGEGDENR